MQEKNEVVGISLRVKPLKPMACAQKKRTPKLFENR
jgi:hypothetical protein